MVNISIVLIEPRGAGNIGSVARAMKNTGFSCLRLVNPADYKNDEAYSMACRADDILRNAEVFDSLEDAVRDSQLVAATTRRAGRQRSPLLPLYMGIPKIVSAAKQNRVSILFGREDKGIRTDELSRCDILLKIHTHKALPSINLAQAVFTICHHIFMTADPEKPPFMLAEKKEVEEMYLHIEEVLVRLGYKDKGGGYLLKTIMRNLKMLAGRAGLMQKEVNMIRGICTQIDKMIGIK